VITPLSIWDSTQVFVVDGVIGETISDECICEMRMFYSNIMDLSVKADFKNEGPWLIWHVTVERGF
jgi:hypothetical protein